MNVAHLVHCPDGFAETADAFLTTENVKFPAHTLQLALHSQFIQELVLSTGPVSQENPLVLDTALADATPATVALLLKAVYLPGSLDIDSAEQAWRLYKTADALNLPAVLQQCKAYIRNNSLTALLATSGSTIEWLLALNLDSLEKQCVKKVAHDFLAVSCASQLQQLPFELLLLIMQEMAVQNAKYAAEVTQKTADVMLRRNGHALCHSRGKHCHDYKFFCEDIDCPGHELRWSQPNTDNAQGTVTLKGTLFCDDGDIVEYAETQNLVDYPCKWRVLDPMLPQSLQTIFEGGYEHIQT